MNLLEKRILTLVCLCLPAFIGTAQNRILAPSVNPEEDSLAVVRARAGTRNKAAAARVNKVRLSDIMLLLVEAKIRILSQKSALI